MKQTLLFSLIILSSMVVSVLETDSAYALPLPTETPTQTPTIEPSLTPTLAPTTVSTVLPTATPIGKFAALSSKPRLRIVNSDVTFRLRDTFKYPRNYYIVLINEETEQLYMRKRIRAYLGSGKLKVKDLQCGNYRAYTLISRKNKKNRKIFLHSNFNKFTSAECAQQPIATPTTTWTPTPQITPTQIPTATSLPT